MIARRASLWIGAACVAATACKSSTSTIAPLGNVEAGSPHPVADAAAPVDANVADAPGSDVDAGQPFCNVDYTWTTVPSTQWITGVQRFGGITPNELTIAWTADLATLSVATRPVLTQPFGTPTTISTESNAIADDRIALAMSGLTIIAVDASRSTFVAFTNQDGSWGPATADQFGNLRAMAMDTQAQFFDPMLGADGAFYYLFAPSGSNAGPPAMYQSTWNGQQRAWNTGVVLTNTELASADATHLRRPTGASGDGLTLFFFDESAGNERAAWRVSPDAPFTFFRDLPMFPEAAPSGHCERLYFTEGTPPGANVDSER